jgi:hypothetical protein
LATNDLAKPFVKAMKAFEKQLTKQRQYDFGLRAYLAIMKFSGTLIKEGNSPAYSLVTSIHMNIAPSLTKDDLKIFI